MSQQIKTINGYGPYEYKVTYEDGEHHWEYIGPAGETSGSSSTGDVGQDEEGTSTDDDSHLIEDVETYSDESPQIHRAELAEELGIDAEEITSIKSVTGEGKEEFDWVNRDSVTNGQYEVYVDSELAERVRIRKEGSNAKLTMHDSRHSLTEGIPGTSWRESGFDEGYDSVVGKDVEMELESGETVKKELVNADESDSSETSPGLNQSGYTAIVDDGSIRWTDSGPVYAKTGIMFDTEETEIESIEIKD